MYVVDIVFTGHCGLPQGLSPPSSISTLASAGGREGQPWDPDWLYLGE